MTREVEIVAENQVQKVDPFSPEHELLWRNMSIIVVFRD